MGLKIKRKWDLESLKEVLNLYVDIGEYSKKSIELFLEKMQVMN